MVVVSACPNESVLQQLALGKLPPEEVERLAKHCEQCERCIRQLHALKTEDTLTEALAVQSTASNPIVDALIERLKRTPPPLLPAAELSATVAGGDTPPRDAAGEWIENTQTEDVSLSPPQAADEIGRLGGYRVLKMLGSGGMGMVYQAEDVHLQRPLALKVMKAAVAKNPGNRERFLREARAAAQLKSDHVVTIHQVGEDNQVVFLAMEYLEGMSLDDWLKKGRKATLAQTVRIGRQIALGLADAHACGLIHRDIKPGNIWLDSRHQGRVKLLDFGLARGTAEEVHLTQSGAIVGTPAFMAPEQARGEKVDHRCDLFSLGVVLYRLTTGQMPFRGDNTMSILTALALDKPTPPRNINADIPPRMAELIERLLAKEREQRPATAKTVAEELANIEREATQPATDEQTLQAASAGERSRLVPRLRYRLRKYVAAASLLLVLGGLAAGIVIIVRDKDGNKVTEVIVPDKGSFEVKDNGDNKTKPLPKEQVKIDPAPLPPLLPGEPLSPTALVQHPAKLPGVRSWSIESRSFGASCWVAAYRPDGKRLAVGSEDGSIRIWEPQTGRLVQVLLAEDRIRWQRSLAWSPDGRVLAAAYLGGNQPLRLWEAETGRLLRTFEAPNPMDYSILAWSPDGRRMLAARRGECHIWNAADGKLLHKFPPPDADPGAFSPDRKYLAGWRFGRSEMALIWDVETGKEIRLLTGAKQGGGGMRLSWSPDGKQLALGAANGVFLWEAATGKEIFHYKDILVHGVTWSPDGRLWALQTSNHLLALDGEKKGRVLECSGPFSPDGKTVVGMMDYWSGMVRLYDPATGKELRTLSEGRPNYERFAWSAAGPSVAVNNARGETFLSSVDTGQTFAALKDSHRPLAWSPDGKRLATGGRDRTLILWEDGGKTRIPLKGHQGEVGWLAWSPDGKRLASSSWSEKRVLLWDAEKVEPIRELGPFPAPAESVTWSPDGRLIAFNVQNVGWNIWNVEQNKLANDPKQWNSNYFLFAPHAQSALVQSHGSGIYRLRELATGKEHGQLPYTRIQSPAWSPDGRLLAVPVGAKVELWRGDLHSRKRTLKATQPIDQVAFSADGKLVAGQAWGRLHLWETDTGRLRGILMMSESNRGLTLTPDGQYIGNQQVDRGIVVVVQKDDGTQEVLEPADFEQKYGWKNEPDKVHLLKPLPPPPYPLPGMPMGPQALVREPAELADPNAMSWTIETVNPRGLVKALAYRPDGKLLATSGEDGTIRIWDTANGKLVRMLVGDPVESLSWSKDGKVLTAGNPKSVREWDVDTGRLLRRIAGVANPATKEAHSPEGKQTARIEATGVHLYDASGKKTHTLEEGNGKQQIVRLDDANGFPLGVRLPFDAFGQLTVTADGYYRGNARIERLIRMVVQKRDGSTETLPPREFEQKYGWKNEPDKVRLLDK